VSTRGTGVALFGGDAMAYDEITRDGYVACDKVVLDRGNYQCK
jgi:hypothetical protein